LIEIANPHFIELKSYMHVGYSTKRLRKENMLYHYEVREYANIFIKKLNGKYVYMDEHPPSRIVVLQNTSRYINRWIS